MTELKTLKDIEIQCGGSPAYNAYELKQEAIKWVKELRRKTGTTGSIDYRLSFKECE